MTTAPPRLDAQTVELTPRYGIPLGLVLLSLPLVFLQPWVALALGLFGLFLTLQTVWIRLRFTLESLEVYRSGQLIRAFPYQDWQTWRIFWRPVPLLFYFKEVKSIHFLPIIFDPQALEACLNQRCPRS
ncbi:MAG: DUF3119 family protein [Cyanobacteriota bacterium]|jgi:hypothetical protein